MADLPRVATDCSESSDRESEPMKSSAIDDQKKSTDASVCCPEPRLGVSKGQGKGKWKLSRLEGRNPRHLARRGRD
jgi:hypothetical protein